MLGIPGEAVELFLGGCTLLYLMMAVAYAAKLVRRPGVLHDELQVLPGRAGVAAAVLSMYLLAAVLAPYVPAAARVILLVGLGAHLALVGLSVLELIRAPAERRRVTPVWHLTYSGFVVGALVAPGVGFAQLGFVLAWVGAASALLIWGASAEQFRRERVPAPLRPLLAIHLSPGAILGSIALEAGQPGLALGFAVFAAALLVAFAGSARWMLNAGFSPLWGALTFPVAATAQLWLAMGGGWQIAGAAVLILATLGIPVIAFRVLRAWASGALAIKTNAAVA
jgi:tellurite resistance protein